MTPLKVCPLCHQKNFQILLKQPARQIAKCQEDDLVFVNPQPTAAQITALYGPKYFKNYTPYFKNRKAHISYFNRKLDQIETLIPQKGKILDIGCATGFFLKRAKQRGWKVTGIDVSDFALNYCKKKKLNVKKGTITQIKFPPRSFDVVVSLQTIEHEASPQKHANAIHKILKTKGLAVFTTPNHDSWTRKLMGSSWFGYRHKEHLFFFTPQTLKQILKTAGFTKIKTQTDHPRIFTLSYYLTRLADFYPSPVVKTTTTLIKKIIGKFPVPALTDPWGDLIVFAWK